MILSTRRLIETNIINVDFKQGVATGAAPIRIDKVRESRALRFSSIAPSTEVVTREVAEDRAATPTKDIKDIQRICDFLMDQHRYRDYMLFVVGINFGLRVSDLRTLRFCDLINEDCTFKQTFPILEQKTKKTRSVKKNRYITINMAVMDAVELFLAKTPGCTLSDYMFRSDRNLKAGVNEPIHRNTIEKILKGIGEELHIDAHMSTHTLRKTFGYHQMMMSGNSQRKLLVLQKMFGHSSAAITLSYIGITDDEITAAYENLNLGSRDHHYYIDSDVVEDACGRAR